VSVNALGADMFDRPIGAGQAEAVDHFGDLATARAVDK
jgi:hypothetical protein